MTIAFPISLEDKTKLSFNYMKGETKINNYYTGGRDLGNEKAKSKF